jgi:hypothetical protein
MIAICLCGVDKRLIRGEFQGRARRGGLIFWPIFEIFAPKPRDIN